MSDKHIMSQKIENIASQILIYKKRYYSGASIISDEQYDALENELKKLSPNHPVLSLVGYQISDKETKVFHSVPMLSLAKTYSLEDLHSFVTKYSCVVLDKLDGMAISLEYDEGGNFKRASTRGNGVYGEDVTEHVYHILHIPKKIEMEEHWNGVSFEIRGEVYFPISAFQQFEERFDSFRNAVPGTMNRKEVEEAIDVLHVLKFFPYDLLVFDTTKRLLSAREFSEKLRIDAYYRTKIQHIEKIGFQVNKSHYKVVSKDIESNELESLIEEWFEEDNNYKIDGLVFRIQDESLWESLGNTSHHPRGSLAFKRAGETAQTEIIAIEENIGRSGKVTFRAKLNPVVLSGAKISYATLHNAEFIEQGNYAVGSKVEIVRSGEVIPAIIRLVEQAKEEYKLPENCPCGYPLNRQGPDLICLEKRVCNFKDQESLVHFISSLDIMGVSDKIILKIRNAGLVSEPADFYLLKVEDLLQLSGFAQKSAENVVSSIQNTKQVPLAKFLTSLGLKRGGAVKCQEVARKFVSLENVLALDSDTLKKEKGFAEKSADDFVESIKEKEKIIKNLLHHITVLEDFSGNNIEKQKDHPYFGKNICITGALSRTREEYISLLDTVGAKFVNTVTSKTNFLVCNEESASSKYKQAVKLNIPILNEEEFTSKLHI